MATDVSVREAQEDDLEILINNNKALADETESIKLNSNILKKGIIKALKREECHYFVAIVNGGVVGQLMITYEWSDWRNGVIWWIQSVYVKPNYRKQGIFRALFQHVESMAKINQQVKALRLYVMHNNDVGQRTYQSLGMNDSGYILFEKEVFT